MDNYILHMDLDSFFVSVERVLDPILLGKAVIIGGTSKRGVVSSCSYEARAFGVHSAMAGFKAHQLCPDGIFMRGSYEQYGRFSKQVTEVIASRVPLFEKASIDEFYIDLTGMDKYFGCYEFAKTLREEIMEETKLPISFGLGTNKVIAKMATNLAKPNGHLFIPPGEELSFLDPQEIKAIPGLGKKTVEFLNRRGISTIKELREIGLIQLEEWLGKYGQSLWNRANGIGSTTIKTDRGRKSISKEHTFHDDINDKDYLRTLLHEMVEQLAHQLRIEDKRATSLGIKLRTPDFTTQTKQMVISATNYEHEIIPEINRFFDQIYHGQKLRLIGLRLAGLTDKAYQGSLFDDVEKQEKIYKSIDEIKQNFGKGKLNRGSSLK